MKITRASIIATEIQKEIGGHLNTIRAKVAGIIFMNPEFTDEEVAAAFVINQ
jgi:hypothetical protein